VAHCDLIGYILETGGWGEVGVVGCWGWACWNLGLYLLKTE